jgi:hypothetical protein
MRSRTTARNSKILAESPFHGTLLERMIGAVGLPYFAGSAVYVLVAGPPGLVIFHSLGSGTIAKNLEIFFS